MLYVISKQGGTILARQAAPDDGRVRPKHIDREDGQHNKLQLIRNYTVCTKNKYINATRNLNTIPVLKSEDIMGHRFIKDSRKEMHTEFL